MFLQFVKVLSSFLAANQIRQVNLLKMFRKKNPFRTNYSSIFLQKFRILPFFSFIYTIRIRFFGPGELIQNHFRAAQYFESSPGGYIWPSPLSTS